MTTTELTLPQRAAIALGADQHEKELITLAKQSTNIIAVLNADGREQAHRAGMILRTARVNITKTGKDARDDATAFSKAVIAEEKRLIGIIEPEETRIIALRDAFDAEEQARKDALIASELARVGKIQDDISFIRNMAAASVGTVSQHLFEKIQKLEEIELTEDRFSEFVTDAKLAINETKGTLTALYNSTFEAEAMARQTQYEREVADAQVKKEREELAAAQAQLKLDQEAMAELQRHTYQLGVGIVKTTPLVDTVSNLLASIDQKEKEDRQRQADASFAALQHTKLSTIEPESAIRPDWQPSADELIQVLIENYGKSRGVILYWLHSINFNEVE